jgi:hypothetical protein
MPLFALIGLLAGWLLSQSLPVAVAQEDNSQKRAVERLRAAGATVKVDEKAPGQPAVQLEFGGSATDFALVTHLQSLRRVFLFGANVTDTHLEHLTSLPNLQSIELCTDFISDAGLERLSKLPRLRELRLLAVGLCVTDRGLRHLGKLKNLESLSVIQVTEASDAWMTDLKGMLKLRKLEVWRMDITDRGVELISKLPALEHLDLSETAVTDRCLEYLQKMRKLKFVSVADTKVTAQAIEIFRKQRPDVDIAP